jgi:hypothetical protein
MQTRLAVPFLAPLLAVGLTACAAKVLAVGSGDGNDSPTSGDSIPTQGSCTSASCANQSLTCVGGGAPTNLECIPHPDASGPTIFTGTCILEGDCTATGKSDSGASSTMATTSCITMPLSSCGSDSNGAQVCASTFGGSGIVTVELAPMAGDAGAASTELSAFFSSAQGGTSTQQTYGACVFDPYGAAGNDEESGAQGPAPNPGAISIDASGFTGSLYPACDGTYASVTKKEIPATGSPVSLAWALPAGNPWQFPTSFPSIPTPHVLTLPAASPFAASYPSEPPVMRGRDDSESWLASGATGHLEQAIFLLTQGTATLTCSFPASDGSGTIPAEALLELAAGKASYVVFSQTTQVENDAEVGWQLELAINAVSTTPNALAKGTVELE